MNGSASDAFVLGAVTAAEAADVEGADVAAVVVAAAAASVELPSAFVD